MSNEDDSDKCVFVKEENNEVIFISETSCDIQVSQNVFIRSKFAAGSSLISLTYFFIPSIDK